MKNMGEKFKIILQSQDPLLLHIKEISKEFHSNRKT